MMFFHDNVCTMVIFIISIFVLISESRVDFFICQKILGDILSTKGLRQKELFVTVDILTKIGWNALGKILFRDIMLDRYYAFQDSNIMTLKSRRNDFLLIFMDYAISRLCYPSLNVKPLFLGKSRKILMESSIET